MEGNQNHYRIRTVEWDDPSKQPTTTSIFQKQAQNEVAPKRSKSATIVAAGSNNDQAICLLEERTEQNRPSNKKDQIRASGSCLLETERFQVETTQTDWLGRQQLELQSLYLFER
jgi:hypothetical protein